MSTAIVTSDTSINHETGLGHPEKPDRVTTVIKNLKKNKNLIWKKNKKFDSEILDFTHTPEYIKQVKNSFPKNNSSSIAIFQPYKKHLHREFRGTTYPKTVQKE